MRDMPRSIDQLTVLSREVAARPERQRRLEVLDYAPSSVLPEKQIALSGTVTVFLARTGSELLARIRDAVKAKDRRDRTVAAHLHRQFKKRKRVPLAEAVDCARAQPVIADLRHGGRTLVENIVVPEDLEVAVIALPYNGGQLGALTLVEHFLEDDDLALEAVALRNVPPLTAAEKAALERVPPEMAGVNVGRGPGDVACSVVLLTVAVVVEVAIVAATFTVVKAHDDHSMDHVNPAAIDDLGPVGTARALVNLRRDILQGRSFR